MKFTVHRFGLVDSTNLLAAKGEAGEVFVAAEQSAGRGRLDHRWLSRPGENLLMSVVLDVSGISPAEVATLPLLAGLAVADTIQSLSNCEIAVAIKWPNDVYIDTRKVCGILCERHGDKIVAGIGVNVRQFEFPREIEAKATSLLREGMEVSVDAVLDAVLKSLNVRYETWRNEGFAAVHADFTAIDFLKGRHVTVMRTDDDNLPFRGICRGISADGSLIVGDERIYAGEVRW